MDKEDRQVLNKSMPYLVETVKITPLFKAALVAAEMLDDDTVEQVLATPSDQETIFQIAQRLKALRSPDTLAKFADVLHKANQAATANHIEQVRTSISGSRSRQSRPVEPKRNNDDTTQGGAPPDRAAVATQSKQSRPVEPKRNNDDTTQGDAPPDRAGVATQLEVDSPEDAKVPSNNPPPKAPAVNANVETPSPAALTTSELQSRVLQAIGQESPSSRERFNIGDIVTTDDYERRVRKFAKGQNSAHPGQFDTPKPAMSLMASNLDSYPPHMALRLCQLLGGNTRLRLDRRNGKITMVTIDGDVAYCGVKLYVMPSGNKFGERWLQAEATLEEALGGTLGSFPRRLEERESVGVALDVLQQVQHWFLQTDSYVLNVWI